MKFIGAHWAGDYDEFKRKFGDIDDVGDPSPLAQSFRLLSNKSTGYRSRETLSSRA